MSTLRAVLLVGALVGATGLVEVQPAEAAATRIAYVDFRKVLARSVAGVAARDQLERENAGIQKDAEVRRVEIEKLRDELEKKGLVLSAEAKREKEETLQRKLRDYNRFRDDVRKELQQREQVLSNKIVQEITAVVQRMGKEKGFLLILEVQGATVIYGDPEADVTDEIIRAYDQEKGKK